MNPNKRGVSTLIATVLIVGITIAAFGLIYVYIIPLVREGIEVSQLCADTQLNIVKERGYTCYDNPTTTLNVQVERGPKNTSLSGIQIIYSEGGDSYIATEDVSIGSAEELRPNAMRLLNMNYLESGFTNIDSVSIAAVLQLGNKETVCNPVPEVIIASC